MVTVQQREEQATCLHEIHKEDFQTENYEVKRRGDLLVLIFPVYYISTLTSILNQSSSPSNAIKKHL